MTIVEGERPVPESLCQMDVSRHLEVVFDKLLWASRFEKPQVDTKPPWVAG